MGIREERPAYGEKKQKSEWILPPKPLTRELPPERAQAQQPNETGAAAMPAALEEKAPETTGAALAAKKAVPAEKEAPLAEKEALPKQMEMFDNRLLSETARKRHRLIGQVFETYWLVEYDAVSTLLTSMPPTRRSSSRRTSAYPKDEGIHLPAREPADHPDTFLTGGGSLKTPHEGVYGHRLRDRAFGGNEYAVRAVPDNLFSLAKKDLLMELIDGLSDESMGKNVESIYDRIATMSCKAAVKGNNELSFAEADKLIDELLKLENPYNCPHGRPTIVAISKYEMEKKFKRIV